MKPKRIDHPHSTSRYVVARILMFGLASALIAAGITIAMVLRSYPTIWVGSLMALAWLLLNAFMLLLGHGILRRMRREIARLSEEISSMNEKTAYAERTKMDFISTISHELRTPLTAIKGWGETLMREKDLSGETAFRGIGIIVEESRRLEYLVEDLLDFSHIQTNRLVLRRERIDVLAELDDAVFLFRERAARNGVELISGTPEIPAPMAGDPARIRQVFINLLDNAFKHTPQGGSVKVAANCAPEQQELCVVIRDTGCGVDEKDLPHLTEKFYKSSASTKGSGIGLAVVQEILKAHGCALRLESAAGQGFQAHMTFPLLKKTIGEQP